MLAESQYYKDDLLGFADRLERWIAASRWSERRWYDFESRLLHAALSIRRLTESALLSERVAGQSVPVDVFSPTGKRITRMNRHRIDELYDLESARRTSLKLPYVANQIIHSYVLAYWVVEDRSAVTLFVSSDRERSKRAFALTTAALIPLLRSVGSDYPGSVSMAMDAKRGDYVTESTDGGEPAKYSLV